MKKENTVHININIKKVVKPGEEKKTYEKLLKLLANNGYEAENSSYNTERKQ